MVYVINTIVVLVSSRSNLYRGLQWKEDAKDTECDVRTPESYRTHGYYHDLPLQDVGNQIRRDLRELPPKALTCRTASPLERTCVYEGANTRA